MDALWESSLYSDRAYLCADLNNFDGQVVEEVYTFVNVEDQVDSFTCPTGSSPIASKRMRCCFCKPELAYDVQVTHLSIMMVPKVTTAVLLGA